MGMVRRSTSTTPRRTPQLFSGGLQPQNLQGQVYQVQVMMMRSCSKQNIQECSEIVYRPFCPTIKTPCLGEGAALLEGATGATQLQLGARILTNILPFYQ